MIYFYYVFSQSPLEPNAEYIVSLSFTGQMAPIQEGIFWTSYNSSEGEIK